LKNSAEGAALESAIWGNCSKQSAKEAGIGGGEESKMRREEETAQTNE
jgi:hypothetical protein